MSEAASHPEPVGGRDEVLVLGAGLAGSFAAHALAQAGWPVRVVDRQPVREHGPAAYAPRVALLQPKIVDRGDKPGQWLREGVALARGLIETNWADDPRVAWRRCGALHIAHDDRSRRRLTRYFEQFGDGDMLRWVEPGQSTWEVGISVRCRGLLLPLTGIVRPAGLCAALLRHPRIRVEGGREVIRLQQDAAGWSIAFADGSIASASSVVVANAIGGLALEPTAHLDLRPVRGQVALIDATDLHYSLGLGPGGEVRRALCYGGYLMPAVDGRYTLGASFIPGDRDTGWRDGEHRAVLERFSEQLESAPRWDALSHPHTGWAGTRCTTPTRLPYAGPVERNGQRLPGLYASLGHGSHGIASAARSAQQIVEKIT